MEAITDLLSEAAHGSETLLDNICLDYFHDVSQRFRYEFGSHIHDKEQQKETASVITKCGMCSFS